SNIPGKIVHLLSNISIMKKALLFACTFLLSVSAIYITVNGKFLKHDNDAKQGAGDDAEDYFKWEQRRLADPSTGKIPDNIRAKELEFAATLPSDATLPNDRIASTSWASRGPWNVGGRTRAFAADVKN